MSSLQKSSNLAKKIINVTKAMTYLHNAHVEGMGIETVDNEIAGIKQPWMCLFMLSSSRQLWQRKR